MVRPDYRRFITHSAKGSTWEKHKYIKRVDGTYYYPDSYKGGRHLPKNDGDKKSSESEDKTKTSADSSESEEDWDGELSQEDIEKLAMEVWRGNFGNGQQRRDLLGEYYDEVQKRVNELAGSVGGKRSTNSVSQKEIDDAKNILDKVSSEKISTAGRKKLTPESTGHKGVDMDSVLSAYKKKK